MKRSYMLPVCLAAFALTACGGLSQAEALSKAQAILDYKNAETFALPSNQKCVTTQKVELGGFTIADLSGEYAVIDGQYSAYVFLLTQHNTNTSMFTKLYYYEKDGVYYSASYHKKTDTTEMKTYSKLSKEDFDSGFDSAAQSSLENISTHVESAYSDLQVFVDYVNPKSSSSSSGSSSSKSYQSTSSYSYSSSGDGNLVLKGDHAYDSSTVKSASNVDMSFDNYIPTSLTISIDSTVISTNSSLSSASSSSTQESTDATYAFSWNEFDVTYVDFEAEGYTLI